MLQICQLYFFFNFFSTISRAKNFTSPLYYNFAVEIIAAAVVGGLWNVGGKGSRKRGEGVYIVRSSVVLARGRVATDKRHEPTPRLLIMQGGCKFM